MDPINFGIYFTLFCTVVFIVLILFSGKYLYSNIPRWWGVPRVIKKFKNNIFIILNILVFLLYGLSDAITTYITVSGGHGYEFNPIMAYLISEGWSAFFIIKLGGLLLGLVLLHRIRIIFKHKIIEKIYLGCLLFLIFLGLFLTISNTFIFFGR